MIGNILGYFNGSNRIIEEIQKLNGGSVDIELNPTINKNFTTKIKDKIDEFKKEFKKQSKDILMPDPSFKNAKMKGENLVAAKMNLKQIRKDYDLQGIIGTDELFDAEVVNRYATSIQGVNEKEAITLLQRQGLSVEQQKQVLGKAEELAMSQALNASLVEETISNSALSASQKQEILTSLGVIDANTGEVITTKQVTAAQVQQVLTTKGIVDADAQAIMAQLGLSSANITASATTSGFTTSIYANIAAIRAWMASNPIGWVLLIVSAIVAATVAIIQFNKNAEQKIENIKKKAEEAKTAIESIKSAFKNTKETVDDVAKEFAELSQGVDQISGKNISLSTEDYEKFLDLSNQLADLFPSLTRTYDENGNAIVKLSGDVNTIVGSLQNLVDVQRELANQEIAEKLPEVYAGVKENTKVYNEELKNQKSMLEGLRTLSNSEEINEILKNGSIYITTTDQDEIDKVWARYEEYKKAFEAIGEMATADFEQSPIVLDDGSAGLETTLKFSLDYNYHGFSDKSDIDKLLQKTEGEVLQLENKINNQWSSLSNNLMQGIQTDGQYKMLNDSAQSFVQQAIGNLDYDELTKQFGDGEEGYKKLEEYIDDNIIGLFKNSEVQNLATRLFTLDFSNMSPEEIKSSIMEYIDKIVKVAEGLNIEGADSDSLLKIFGLDGYVSVSDNFEKIKDQIANEMFSAQPTTQWMLNHRDEYLNDYKEQIDEFAKQYSINTQDELAAFNDAWEKSNGDLEKAFRLYIQHLNEKNKKKSFDEVFNSNGFKEQKEDLLELAKAGELTPETLESTKEYKDLLAQTGLSAESCKDKIYNLLTAQEKLAGAHTGLENLKSAYEEFKEYGFVTSKTLESLPDEWKESLEGFDIFSQIVGDSNNDANKIQQAFNDIVKEYLLFTQTLNEEDLISDDVETQERAMRVFTDNLKKMGITNADVVAKQAKESLDASKKLMSNAEQEYIDYLRSSEDGYMGYLKAKNDVDFQYIESTASYNSQFINSLGQGYETDYNNWVGLLKDKELAYQRFAKALDGNGDGDFVYDPNKSIIDNLLANGKSVTFYNIVEAETAKAEYDRISKKYEELRNSLTFNAEFTSNFSPEWNGDTMDGNTPSETTFDFIETRLSNLNKALEETKEIAEDTFNGWTDRSNAYDNSLAKIAELRTEQEKARARYLAEAEKSGISGADRDLVENGDIEGINAILTSSDEKRIKKIQDYQEWYNKVVECDEAIAQLDKDEQEWIRSSREFKWETFDYLIDSISRVTEEAEYLIGLLSNEDLFDDNGNMTKYGDATLALRFSNIDTYNQLAKDQLEEINELRKVIQNGDADQETIDRYNDLVDAHRENINAMNEEKQSILDLVEEGYNKQLDTLQKIIDKKKESLNAEKDLYDYQKTVEEQSKKVTSLQRQYDVYKNDMSEEGKAQAQKIKVELEAAQEELEQTQYDKYLSDQEAMLDQLSADYEEWMNNRLDDEKALLKQIADGLSSDGAVVQTLKDIATQNGTEVSTDIENSILQGTTTAINKLIESITGALGGNAEHYGNAGEKPNEYASGIKRSGKEWAWTQEEGVELIRTKDGALLTPLDNSMVFNNESSKRLWEFSQNPVEYLNKLGMQDISPQIDINTPKLPELSKNASVNPVINLGGINIVCNEVSNADEIVNDLISNKKFEKAMFTAVGNAMTGGNSLGKYRY